MKAKAAILVSSFAVLLFMVVGGLGGVRASSTDGAYRQLQVYSEVLSRVNSEYVEDPNIPKVTDGALHGLLEALDPNSSYLSPKEYQDYKSKKTDAKADIGAAISKRFGYAAVISVVPGGPADKAGIQGSDIFEAIEGHSTREMSLAEIRALLSGQPGSSVNVSVVRARRAEPQKLTITRDVVAIPTVSEKMMDDGVGYIKADTFSKGKAQEIATRYRVPIAACYRRIRRLVSLALISEAGFVTEGRRRPARLYKSEVDRFQITYGNGKMHLHLLLRNGTEAKTVVGVPPDVGVSERAPPPPHEVGEYPSA